jgi:hypothetical protein
MHPTFKTRVEIPIDILVRKHRFCRGVRCATVPDSCTNLYLRAGGDNSETLSRNLRMSESDEII